MDLIKNIGSRDVTISIDANGISRNNLNGNVLVLPGQIEYFAMQTPPKGWLECNGNYFDPNIYIDLSNAIGKRWGNNLEYKVPDLRGCFIRSWSNNSNNYDVNRVLNEYQEDSFKEHNHAFNKEDLYHKHDIENFNDGEHNHELTFENNWNIFNNGYGISPGGWEDLTNKEANTGRHPIVQTQYGGGHSHGDLTSNSAKITGNTTLEGSNESRPNNYPVLICIKY